MVITGLIGYPTDQSISPALYGFFADEYSLEYSHLKLNVLPGNGALKKTINSLKVLNFKGFKVTIPYKLAVIKYLDEIRQDAVNIGAVNTVVNNDGKLIGYNTDWYAGVKAIEYILKRKIHKTDRVLIIGSGGVARALAFGVLKYTQHVAVIYRYPVSLKTKSFLRDFKNQVNFITYSDKVSAAIAASNIICNATSVGMWPNQTNMPVNETDLLQASKRSDFSGKLFFDVIFNPQETLFLKTAKRLGAKIQGGLDMMLFQGVVAFKLWTGKTIPEKTVVEIREKLARLL